MANTIKNRQAYFNYHIEKKYVAGIVLQGTEVKSIREGKVSFNDAFCLFNQNELWLRGLYIAPYNMGTTNNHIAVQDRKLLLNKRELRKIQNGLKEQGYTIVPLTVFFNEKNLVKVEIGIGKGKKLYDKRASIKEKDVQRDIKRYLK